MEKPIFKIANSITRSNILVFFLRPSSKYIKYICFIYNVSSKTVSMLKIKNSKNCENMIKVINEIKQYVKNTNFQSH